MIYLCVGVVIAIGVGAFIFGGARFFGAGLTFLSILVCSLFLCWATCCVFFFYLAADWWPSAGLKGPEARIIKKNISQIKRAVRRTKRGFAPQYFLNIKIRKTDI